MDTTRKHGWETPEMASEAAERTLGRVGYGIACAALFDSRNDAALDRGARRLAKVSRLLVQMLRLSRALMQATYAEPVPFGDHPEAPLWSHITALCREVAASSDSLRKLGAPPRPSRKGTRATAERAAFLKRFVALSRPVMTVDDHGSTRRVPLIETNQLAAGLAYFAIDAGLDDPPTPRLTRTGLSLTGADVFRRHNVKEWQKLLRRMRTKRERGVGARRNR